jgi:apoptosis-inducing factor 2
MTASLSKTILFVKLVGYSLQVYFDFLSRERSANKQQKKAAKLQLSSKSTPTPASERKNIVVVGASFAGYHAARLIALSLPPNSDFRVVVVEPNSHFQFTWVLPRFCVVEGHEHKAFIPYGPYLAGVVEGNVRWVRDRVTSVGEKSVRLQASGEEIPYSYLVIATGSGAGDRLPSRVGETGKEAGLERLREIQRGIKSAKKAVIVGGGAAGVELATDTKQLYPEKDVVLVHSRSAVMHRFGPELQKAALDGLRGLGVDVILGDRVVSEDATEGSVMLTSGKKIDCDYFVCKEREYDRSNADRYL